MADYSFKTDNSQYNAQRVDELNKMYDAQLQSQKNALESSYNQSRSAAQAARDKLPGQYQQQANDLAVQHERNKQNFNRQAAGNGINTGTASQAALAQNSAWQRDYGSLRTAEANAVSEADRGLADLEAQYQSGLASAQAQSDYQRASALLKEQENAWQRDQNSYQQNLARAELLAKYGDFSGYAALYGQEQADNMQRLWNAQNPGLAYNTGAITAEQYKTMTGKYPPGYRSYSYRGSGGNGSNGGGNDPLSDTEEYGPGMDQAEFDASEYWLWHANNLEELNSAWGVMQAVWGQYDEAQRKAAERHVEGQIKALSSSQEQTRSGFLNQTTTAANNLNAKYGN